MKNEIPLMHQRDFLLKVNKKRTILKRSIFFIVFIENH
jgi:hypothetical protein